MTEKVLLESNLVARVYTYLLLVCSVISILLQVWRHDLMLHDIGIISLPKYIRKYLYQVQIDRFYTYNDILSVEGT